MVVCYARAGGHPHRLKETTKIAGEIHRVGVVHRETPQERGTGRTEQPTRRFQAVR